jgi:WD40 repeat protein
MNIKKIFILVIIIFSGGYLYGQVLLQNIENAHTGKIISLDADANGSLIISGGIDNRAHLWDANTGQKIMSFSDVEGYPAVLFTSDFKRFITSGYSGKITVRDTETKKGVLLLKENTADILSISVNPVNANIAGGGKDGKIIIWDQDGKLLRSFIGHAGEILKISFMADGTSFLSVSGSEVKIWDANNFNLLKTLTPEAKILKALSVSYNLKQIAIVTGKRTIEIWETKNFTKEYELPKTSHDIKTVGFSPDDKYISIGGEDGSLTIINLANKEVTKEILNAHEGNLTELKFSVDGSKLITTGDDCNIRIWSLGGLDIQASIAYRNSLGLYADNQAVNQAQLQDEKQYRGDNLKGLGVSYSGNDLQFGKYYALIIGIDNYTGQWKPLKNGVSDAKAVSQTLKSKYKFDYMKELYNDQATRVNIIKELEWLVQNVKQSDNLLIYYSGHGEYNQTLNKGYWVPVDATATSTSFYISNSDIQTFLGGIKSKHTLLISDACFSGDIFRGNTVSIPFEESDKYYAKVNSVSSRKAITSGGIEPVLDGGKEGHSIFAYYLLKSLNSNSKKYYDASQLFDNIKIPVLNNSDQSPQFNAIKNAGDEGGQFIFLKK